MARNRVFARAQRDEESVEDRTDRRRFLTRGAITAAIAAAGAATLAEPAGATGVTTGVADFDALQIGGANTNSVGSFTSTRLSGSTNSGTPNLTLVEFDQTGTGAGSTALVVRHQGAAASPRTLHATSEAASSAGGVVVWGELTAGTLGTAVLGSAATTDGVGVQADSLGTGLLITDHSVTMPPTSGNWTRGSFVVSGGHVWYCYATGFGAASLWARLSSTFVPLATPVRIYNSIGGDGPLGNGQERSVGVTNGTTIPHTVSAVLTNLACNNPSAAGFLAMFKSGTTWPGTSNLNFQAHQTLSNNATSAVLAGPPGKVAVHCGGASTNFVIDVFGYYV